MTGGGLPTGRPTLVCGSAGSGKTLFAMEFLVHGATAYGEPGIFMAFDETAEDLAQNVASLGFDLADLVAKRRLLIDHVQIDRHDIEETGDYDLEGLFVRLAHAVATIGAKRVVLDTLESLFSNLGNAAIVRAELRRLFSWLKQKGLTAVITGERGEKSLTRDGIEEYVSDCVILLDHRVIEQVSTRRLHIVKYRGTVHGTNEYPFLIDEEGLSVLPITSVSLEHSAPEEMVSSGIPTLDTMLGGRGYYRASSILVMGMSGTGKTSIASHFALAACRRGERCLYLGFEESRDQLVRNMRSIGIDLLPWLDKERLVYSPARSTLCGLEMHLVTIHKLVEKFRPKVLVIDPVTSLIAAGARAQLGAMLLRLVDFLKLSGVTALMTSLTSTQAGETPDLGISSLVDTLVELRETESGNERTRNAVILKSRGIRHSHRVHQLLITDRGVVLPELQNDTAPANPNPPRRIRSKTQLPDHSPQSKARSPSRARSGGKPGVGSHDHEIEVDPMPAARRAMRREPPQGRTR